MVSSSGELDLDNLAPCTHEEADYRMTLHIYDLVRYHIRRLLLRSIDTDVPVICIAYFHDIPELEELWIEFGTAKCYKLIPVYTITTHLGADKCKALLGYHAYTRCDSVSAFFGISKNSGQCGWRMTNSQKHFST